MGESTKALFASRKQQVLRHVDLSRKGSIDDYIRPLVECINSNRDYVTTSSCSGRILIYCEVFVRELASAIIIVDCNRVSERRKVAIGY